MYVVLYSANLIGYVESKLNVIFRQLREGQNDFSEGCFPVFRGDIPDFSEGCFTVFQRGVSRFFRRVFLCEL